MPEEVSILSILGIDLSHNNNLLDIAVLEKLPLAELLLNNCNNVGKQQILMIVEKLIDTLVVFSIDEIYIPFIDAQLQDLFNIIMNSLVFAQVTLPKINLSRFIKINQNNKDQYVILNKSILSLTKRNIQRNSRLQELQ